jgi:hypothetical protein
VWAGVGYHHAVPALRPTFVNGLLRFGHRFRFLALQNGCIPLLQGLLCWGWAGSILGRHGFSAARVGGENLLCHPLDAF